MIARLLLVLFTLCLAAPVWAQHAGHGSGHGGQRSKPIQQPKHLPPVQHQLKVTLNPALGTVQVTDRITLPAELPVNPDGGFGFTLHSGLKITAASPEMPKAHGLAEIPGDPVPATEYRFAPPEDRVLELTYSGSIRHAVDADGTPGLIDPDGVFLAASSHWYPLIMRTVVRPVIDGHGGHDPGMMAQADKVKKTLGQHKAGPGAPLRLADPLVTFDLTVSTPLGWHTVAQGSRTENKVTGGRQHARWQMDLPQDEIYLLAAPFTEYELPAFSPTLRVMLRTPDAALADEYLTAGAEYLRGYEKLLGKYPYSQFVVVENFWETGFGMPSFTLMGPTVLRLPFMLTTSYPHEILHNWWGNGVFVNYRQGNWAEGLTAYLADHAQAERQGNGKQYRRDALVNFWDFVHTGKDFSLVEFRSRHNRASQAVGYGKGMMLFHMLRNQLGDEAFYKGLRHFYRDQRFNRAGFKELERAMSLASKRDLKVIFQQWTRRLAAPDLTVDKLTLVPDPQGFALYVKVSQHQSGTPYQLYLPMVIELEGRKPARRTVKMTRKRQEIKLVLPAKPTALTLDPNFDLFRTLSAGEVPVSLSALYGADAPLYVLPGAASDDFLYQYRLLADAWAKDTHAEIVVDSELTTLPTDRPVWLLGQDNRFVNQAGQAISAAGATLTDAGVVLPEGRYDHARHDLIFAVARDEGAPLGWVAASAPEHLPGLTRKLPHYGKYGYLGFTGEGPHNVLKGAWAIPEKGANTALYRRVE